MSEKTTVVKKDTELSVLLKDAVQLKAATKQEISNTLGMFFKEAEKWEETIASIKITKPTEVGKMKVAREQRLALRTMRLQASKKVEIHRDIMKHKMADDKLEDTLWLKAGQMINETFKTLEVKCEANEKFAERYEIAQKEILRLEREKAIEPLADFIPFGVDFAGMEQKDFDALIEFAEDKKKKKEELDAEQAKEEARKVEVDKLHRERDILLRPYWKYLSPEAKLENFGEWSEKDFNGNLELYKNEELKAIEKYNKELEESKKLAAENEKKAKEAEKEYERIIAENNKKLQAAEKARIAQKKAIEKLFQEKAKEIEVVAPEVVGDSSDKAILKDFAKRIDDLHFQDLKDPKMIGIGSEAISYLGRVSDFITKSIDEL